MADEVVTPEAPAESAEVEAPAAVAEAVVDDKPETFSREYVEDLRKENATYRTRAKELESVFEGLDDEKREGFVEVIKAYKEDPKAGASVIKDIADSWLAEQEAAGITPADEDYVSRAEMKKMLEDSKAEEQQAAQQASILREIEAEATKLGYNPSSETLQDKLAYENLCKIAATLPDYSLAEAHKVLEAQKQKIIDDFLKSKAEDAGNTPTAPVAGGAAPSQEQNPEIKNLEDVEARAISRVEAMKNNA